MKRAALKTWSIASRAVVGVGVLAIASACPSTPSAPAPRPTTSFASGAEPDIDDIGYCMAVADFNRDGVLDVAVAHVGLVTVLTAADGGWTTLARNDAPIDAYARLHAVDLDRDGRMDLLAASAGLAFLRQETSGDFRHERTIATSAPDAGATGVMAFAVADLDGDGLEDVLVAQGSPPFTVAAPEARLLSGVETAPWLGPASFVAALRDRASDLVVAPLDGDQRLDVAVSQSNAGVSFVAGGANGRFDAVRELVPDGLIPDQIATGDLDGDGQQELVVASRSDTPVVVRHSSDGGFEAPVPLPVKGCGVVHAVDLDLDGRAEVVVGCVPGVGVSTPPTSSIVVLRSSSWPRFEVVQRLEADSYLFELQVADLTGDGRLDLAATFLATPGTKLRLWRGVGSN